MGFLLPALIPCFYLVVLPLGVAGQNIGLGVALACTLLFIYLDKATALKACFRQPILKQFLILWALIVVSIVSSTLMAREYKEASRFFWGYTYGSLIPIAGVMLAGRDFRSWSVNLLRFVICFLAVVSVTQLVWGWKFESGSIVDTIRRAQGFYSHPLTLAYVALVVMPWSIAKCLRQGRNVLDCIVCVACVVIILCSQSVTVIALTAFTGFLGVLKLLHGNVRNLVIVAGLAFAAIVLTTENSVSNKIKNVFSGERGDHETPYPDDRMAFWHAHWEMFKDKPMTGFGSGLESEDRAPYYDKIGLHDIKRKYEAHNMFLQYAVEGGVVAVAAFFALLIWLYNIARKTKALNAWEKFYLIATPLVFAAGGLTQNAMQDSEVRYVFLGFIAVLLNRVSTSQASLQVSE